MRFLRILSLCGLLLPLFSALASDQSLLKNGAFTFGGDRPEDWQVRSYTTMKEAGEAGEVTLDPESYHTESPSLKLANAASTEYTFVTQTLMVDPHTSYVLRGWIKEKIEELAGGGMGVRMAVGDGANGDIFAASKPGAASEDWERIEVPFNSGDNDSVRVFLYIHHAVGSAWFDDVEVLAE